jgi:hypothetical protein
VNKVEVEEKGANGVVEKRRVRLEVKLPHYRAWTGFWQWVFIVTLLWLAFAAQLLGLPFNIWYCAAAIYTGMVVAHAVLTTRDG